MKILEKIFNRDKDKIDILEKQLQDSDEIIGKLFKSHERLLEQNNRMSEWIYKILSESNICTVPNRNTITIPIYKTSETFKPNSAILERKEIIIPEIRLVKCYLTSEEEKNARSSSI